MLVVDQFSLVICFYNGI